MTSSSKLFLGIERFPELLQQLLKMQYRIIAPTVAEDAIVYDEIHEVQELPRGWTDEQEPGYYRLQRSGNDRYFDYAVGPHSWKRYLFPPLQLISTAVKGEQGWSFQTHEPDTGPIAFLGVRACELAAIQVQDRVFLQDDYVDTEYERRRQQNLLIAVNCAVPSSNCFCTSMQTGPRCSSGFDLALTELDDGLLVEIGTADGAAVVSPLGLPEATTEQLDSGEAFCQLAVDSISKTMDTDDLRDRLMSQLNHSHWSEVAERCLSCTNCTMVCPTCFCSHVSEVPSLDQTVVERQRRWDSCFNPDFSAVHGHPVRNDVRSRYRQWLTHKLATWHDQFGESGCVGCGRCITWCPVGIDLTVEVAALSKETE